MWGVNTLSCLQYKNIIVDKYQSIPYFPPHCGIQCSIPSKVCPLQKRLRLSCHKNSSQIFDATKLWKHNIPLTYNTKTLISNISETHRFSPQMRLIAYPDHKTTLFKSTPLNMPSIGARVFLPMFKARFEGFWTPFKIFSSIQSVGNFLNFNICFNVWVVFRLVFAVRAFKQHPPCFWPVFEPQNAFPAMLPSEDLLFW